MKAQCIKFLGAAYTNYMLYFDIIKDGVQIEQPQGISMIQYLKKGTTIFDTKSLKMVDYNDKIPNSSVSSCAYDSLNFCIGGNLTQLHGKAWDIEHFTNYGNDKLYSEIEGWDHMVF